MQGTPDSPPCMMNSPEDSGESHLTSASGWATLMNHLFFPTAHVKWPLLSQRAALCKVRAGEKLDLLAEPGPSSC